MSTATENFEAGVAALGLLDGGHADHQQAMRYFTAASDLDPAMCDAWLGRMLCGDNASGTMYRAWRARQQMHAQVSRMGITAAQLWPRFDIGMGIDDIRPTLSPVVDRGFHPSSHRGRRGLG